VCVCSVLSYFILNSSACSPSSSHGGSTHTSSRHICNILILSCHELGALDEPAITRSIHRKNIFYDRQAEYNDRQREADGAFKYYYYTTTLKQLLVLIGIFQGEGNRCIQHLWNIFIIHIVHNEQRRCMNALDNRYFIIDMMTPVRREMCYK